MTIEDQIKDKKLQYDINREAAKISALSSGKIDKYEYLTGEVYLFSVWKNVWKKQTKTIEDKREKQIKAIQDNKRQLINVDDYKDKLLLLNEREIFKDIYNKRLDILEELNNKIDYDNLKYVVERSGYEYNFNKMKDPIPFLKQY